LFSPLLLFTLFQKLNVIIARTLAPAPTPTSFDAKRGTVCVCACRCVFAAHIYAIFCYLLASQYVRLCVTVRMRDAHKMPSENKSLSASLTHAHAHTYTLALTHLRFIAKRDMYTIHLCTPAIAATLDVCRLISVCPSAQRSSTHPPTGTSITISTLISIRPSPLATPFLHPLGHRRASSTSTVLHGGVVTLS